jgi:Mlc titration factor MtfA (ptsG expression regulator)
MEYYIYDIPVFVVSETPESVDLPTFCTEAEEVVPHVMLKNVEVVYVGDFKELEGRNAAFSNAAIEVAHSLEADNGWSIYDESLINEFLGKRRRLKSILEAEGFNINPHLYEFTEYNKKFDEFLSQEVGYPLLLNLTMGLFVSPYGATSIQEYFANGFEKYFLDSPQTVQGISPVLYEKIDTILNDNT